MRKIVRKIMLKNNFLRKMYYERIRKNTNKGSKEKNRDEVFDEIYVNHKWGEKGDFCSGSGTYDAELYKPYVQLISDFISEKNINVVVDIGCGDYYIGNQIVETNHIQYVGVDVSREVVKHNVNTFSKDNVRFIQADAAREDLPEGELCLIREVLQHLSNDNIKSIMRNCSKYKYIIVTNTTMKKGKALSVNADINDGAGTRNDFKSGLYLDEIPFNYTVRYLQRIERNDEEEMVSVLISGGV